MNPTDRKLQISLLLLRLGVAAVMLPWAIDKLVRPDHAAGVFANFYALPGLETWAFTALGIAQILLVLAFLAGIARTWSYGLVTLLHAVSTFSSYRQYLDPFSGPNLLFFAAWPMLAACIALFLLRDRDRLLTWK